MADPLTSAPRDVAIFGPPYRVVTAAMIRDAVLCEHRVERDISVASRAFDDPVHAALWAEAPLDVELVAHRLPGTVVDLREADPGRRVRLTTAAMIEGADHVVGGRIASDGLAASPDVLSRIEGRWTAGLVRTGRATEADERSPRLAYAVEAGLAARILDATGLGDGSRHFVLGLDGGRIWHRTDATWGRSDLGAILDGLVDRVGQIAAGIAITRPAATDRCLVCPHWSACSARLVATDDLTLLRGAERTTRRRMEGLALNRRELADLKVDEAVANDARAAAIGAGMLEVLRSPARHQLLNAPAYLRAPLVVPEAARQLHVSIDYDPCWGMACSMGALECHPDATVPDRHHHFLVGGSAGEEEAFRELWALMAGFPEMRVVLRSPGQVAALRELARRHPAVCTPTESDLFLGEPRVVELQGDLIEPWSEWPMRGAGALDVALAVGVGLDDDDLSGATLGRLVTEWLGGGGDLVAGALRDLNGLLCRASLAAWEAVHDLTLGADLSWPSVRDDEQDRAVGGSEVVDHAAQGHRDDAGLISSGLGRLPETVPGAMAGPAPSLPVPALYATPAARVCLDAIPRETDEGVRVGIAKTYAALEGELPLLGGEAMRPTPGGGLALCGSLRVALPWMDGAIALLERQLRLALWAGRPWLAWRPFCLVGPPGSGKSHLAREIGRIAGVGHAQLDLGGIHDAGALTATARGWTNTKPCWPVAMISAFRCANPILTLDEIEKAGGSRRNGDPQTGLLAMLEPSTAAVYFDTCLMARVDLSSVCWIATANDVGGLPAPLRSRLDVVEIKPPGAEHLDLIVANLLRAAAARWQVPPASLPDLPARAMAVLRDDLARHRSVRRLRRHVDDLLSALLPTMRGDLN